MIAKTLIDKNLLFNTHLVLGCLYMYLDKYDNAREVFDLLRDVGE